MSLNLKVFDAEGVLRATFEHAEDAGAFIAFLGDGATIRFGRKNILWSEGNEEQPASESFDFVASTVYRRGSMMPLSEGA